MEEIQEFPVLLKKTMCTCCQMDAYNIALNMLWEKHQGLRLKTIKQPVQYD